jgi:Phosphate-induced protein 1 conserved region
MKARLLLVLFLAICTVSLNAQVARQSSTMVPTGKGFGVPDLSGARHEVQAFTVTQGNGINYHGGPIMPGNVHIYFIWYGNWTNGPKKSDSQTTVNLIDALYAASGGMGGSPYAKINSTYGDPTHQVTGNFSLVQSTTDNYSKGKAVSDAGIKAIVTRAINNGSLPKDTNALYFVLTSSDVNETSGFCTAYCGWHNHGAILSSDIKYAFVGNPDRCQSACEEVTVGPNGDSGADGMASIMAHETEEAISDPDLNAWWNSNSGQENADQCAWKFGLTRPPLPPGSFNQTFGSHNWLIQMNWENARGGGCDKKKGGTFFNF